MPELWTSFMSVQSWSMKLAIIQRLLNICTSTKSWWVLHTNTSQSMELYNSPICVLTKLWVLNHTHWVTCVPPSSPDHMSPSPNPPQTMCPSSPDHRLVPLSWAIYPLVCVSSPGPSRSSKDHQCYVGQAELCNSYARLGHSSGGP